MHQSFMWFLWLNWRKSTFYPVTAPKDSKCWKMLNYCDVIDTRADRQQLWRHNDRLFPRGCYGRFLSTMMLISLINVCANIYVISTRKRITAQLSTENTSCFDLFIFILWSPVFQHGASLIYIDINKGIIVSWGQLCCVPFDHDCCLIVTK